MNWKAEAAEKLRTYQAMETALENLPREIRRLEAEYTGIGAQRFTGVLTARDLRSREDRILNNIVQRQELRWLLEQAQQWMQTVSAALETLDPQEKGVLRHLYICPKNGGIDKLCEVLHLEKSSVYRKRDTALRKFTLALYGVTEVS